jgi:UDP-N-acetylmuramyl pentapeptide phosphotransferase/UDP-N-acetylglucosamine-1-phosphate transferase
MILPVLAIVTSFFIVLFTTPVFIKVAIMKRLFDVPGEKRKLHDRVIPSMGGVMIFGGTLFSFSLWYPTQAIGEYSYLIACILVLFFVGVKDDIIGTSAAKKLLAHVIVASIMVMMANIRLTSLHGLFGVREIPEWAGVFLSVFTIIVIVNAYNLIDGVDGLAGGVGFVTAISFGIWFYMVGNIVYGVLAFSLAGALLAFLRYNFAPAKIFMGDSGSLTIGFIIAILAIELVEYHKQVVPDRLDEISRPILAMGILVIPLLDTLRIFIYRAAKGQSPFRADSNHIHHRLLALGLNHRKTVLILCGFNILIIATAVLLQGVDPSISFIVLCAINVLALLVLHFIRK